MGGERDPPHADVPLRPHSVRSMAQHFTVRARV
jgi:hypothetical protein